MILDVSINLKAILLKKKYYEKLIKLTKNFF